MTPREQAEVRAREIVIKFFRAEEWERTAVWQKTTQQLIADIRDFAEQAEAHARALREAARKHCEALRAIPYDEGYAEQCCADVEALLTRTSPQEGK